MNSSMASGGTQRVHLMQLFIAFLLCFSLLFVFSHTNYTLWSTPLKHCLSPYYKSLFSMLIGFCVLVSSVHRGGIAAVGQPSAQPFQDPVVYSCRFARESGFGKHCSSEYRRWICAPCCSSDDSAKWRRPCHCNPGATLLLWRKIPMSQEFLVFCMQLSETASQS